MEALDDLAEALLPRTRSGAGLEVALDAPALEAQPPAAGLAGCCAGRPSTPERPAAELFAVHVAALVSVLLGTVRGEVQLPGHLTAYRTGDTLRFRRTAVAG